MHIQRTHEMGTMALGSFLRPFCVFDLRRLRKGCNQAIVQKNDLHDELVMLHSRRTVIIELVKSVLLQHSCASLRDSCRLGDKVEQNQTVFATNDGSAHT